MTLTCLNVCKYYRLVNVLNFLVASEGIELVYVCGNSLGPQPKRFTEIITAESDSWAKK